MTTGVVSALGRTIQEPNGVPLDDLVQTDAAIGSDEFTPYICILWGKLKAC